MSPRSAESSKTTRLVLNKVVKAQSTKVAINRRGKADDMESYTSRETVLESNTKEVEAKGFTKISDKTMETQEERIGIFSQNSKQ